MYTKTVEFYTSILISIYYFAASIHALRCIILTVSNTYIDAGGSKTGNCLFVKIHSTPDMKGAIDTWQKPKPKKSRALMRKSDSLQTRKSGLSMSRKSRSARTEQTGSTSAWGFLKALSPDTIPLAEEQSKTFLEKTVMTNHARRQNRLYSVG